jgi:hypothetical protein
MAHIAIIGAGLGGVPWAYTLRNVTWAREGKWVHLAKVAFEKYFLRKIRTGSVTPVYEKYVLRALGIDSLKTDAA